MEGEEEVHFELNGQSYVLNFNSGDGRWYLLKPVIGGMMEAIEVLDDEAAALHDGMLRIDGEVLKSIN